MCNFKSSPDFATKISGAAPLRQQPVQLVNGRERFQTEVQTEAATLPVDRVVETEVGHVETERRADAATTLAIHKPPTTTTGNATAYALPRPH